jgi:hypothetical protein
MRVIVAQASPSGRFSLRLPDNILRIWRWPALSGTGSAGPRPNAGRKDAEIVDCRQGERTEWWNMCS